MLTRMRRRILVSSILATFCLLETGCMWLPRRPEYRLHLADAQPGIARLLESYPATFDHGMTLVTFLDRRP